MKIAGYISYLLGVVFLIIAGIYFTSQAQNLPHFFPGYTAGLTKVHRTHAIASFVVALCLFAYGWFSTGKKSSVKEEETK